MPETDPTSARLAAGPLHRRTVLAAAISAATSMGDGAVAEAVHPDATLLLALSEMARVAAEQEALQAAVVSLSPDDPRHEAAWARIDALTPSWRAARARAGAVPALTAVGLRAKAEAVRSELALDRTGAPCSDTDALLCSLLGDVLRHA